MPLSPLRPIPHLCTSGRLSRLPRGAFQSPFPHMENVLVAWLEWVSGGLLVVSSKLTKVHLKGCNPPIIIISGPKGSTMRGNEVFSTPARLVWANWPVTNLSNGFTQSERSVAVNCWVKCHIFRSLCRPHAFIFVRSIFHCFIHSLFCRFVYSHFRPHFCYLHSSVSHYSYFCHICYHFAYLTYVHLYFCR